MSRSPGSESCPDHRIALQAAGPDVPGAAGGEMGGRARARVRDREPAVSPWLVTGCVVGGRAGQVDCRLEGRGRSLPGLVGLGNPWHVFPNPRHPNTPLFGFHAAGAQLSLCRVSHNAPQPSAALCLQLTQQSPSVGWGWGSAAGPWPDPAAAEGAAAAARAAQRRAVLQRT